MCGKCCGYQDYRALLMHSRPGVPHAHFAFLPTLGASKKALMDTFVGFGWLLGSGVTAQEIGGALGGRAPVPGGA